MSPDARKISNTSEESGSSLSTLASNPPPTPSQSASQVAQSQQYSRHRATTPMNDPMNSNRSFTPPTISPLSHRPLTATPEQPQDAKSISSSPEVAETELDEVGPDATESDHSSSALSSVHGDSDQSDYEDEPAKSNARPAHPKLTKNKPIVFEPYFRREGFIPAPEVTGNEAWARTKVWNDAKNKYEKIDLEKIAKY